MSFITNYLAYLQKLLDIDYILRLIHVEIQIKGKEKEWY